jgi:O-antigen ligase
MELPTPKRTEHWQNLLLVLAFAIPWAKRGLPTLIGFMVVFAIAYAWRKRSISKPSNPMASLSLGAIFLLLLLGLTFSTQPDEGINEIGIKLSFLIFPLLAFLLPGIGKKESEKIHAAFAYGSLLFILITIPRAIIVSLQHSDLYYLTYDRLSWYMHPTYAAAYQSMSLFVFIELALRKKFIANSRILHFFIITSVALFIALLSSKAGYLSALLIPMLAVIRAYQLGYSIVKSTVVAAVSSVLFLATIYFTPVSSERVQQAVSDIRVAEKTEATAGSATTVSHTSSTQVRLVTWDAAWKVWMNNPFGSGTGDTQSKLNAVYLQKNESYAAERHFNAHNQFLQIGAELGWLGLTALTLCLLGIVRMGRQEFTSAVFIAICVLNFLFESFLEVQAGIVFFSFWTLVYSKLTANN